jgi:hypothetical protein
VADKSTGLNTAIGEFLMPWAHMQLTQRIRSLAGAITGTANAVARRMTGMSTWSIKYKVMPEIADEYCCTRVNTLFRSFGGN